MKRAWIRVDANNTIGRGHLSRCIALAEMIKADFQICFIVLAYNESYCDTLLKDWKVQYIDDDAAIVALLDTEDLLVVDSYAIDNAWRCRFKPLVLGLVDINDIPGDINGATVIINHCPGITASQYTADPNTSFLLGLDYAILRTPFLAYARREPSVVAGKGVFICFGGADPYQLGVAATNALLAGGFTEPIYLVSNADADSHPTLRDASNVTLLNSLSADEMRDYMLKSRLLLLSASILSFEAIALRKPMLALYYVENQALIYQGLVAQGMANGFGFVNNPSQLEGLYECVRALYQSNHELQALTYQQYTRLDGQSDARIRKGMLGEGWSLTLSD